MTGVKRNQSFGLGAFRKSGDWLYYDMGRPMVAGSSMQMGKSRSGRIFSSRRPTAARRESFWTIAVQRVSGLSSINTHVSASSRYCSVALRLPSAVLRAAMTPALVNISGKGIPSGAFGP